MTAALSCASTCTAHRVSLAAVAIQPNPLLTTACAGPTISDRSVAVAVSPFINPLIRFHG